MILNLIHKEKHTKVSDKLYDHIKSMITNGKLRNHDFLPHEEEFANICGINRIHVRKAFTRLESESLIVRTKRKGTYVLYRPIYQLEAADLTNLQQYVLKHRFSMYVESGFINKIKDQHALSHKKQLQIRINHANFAIYEWKYPSDYLDPSLTFEQIQQFLLDHSQSTTTDYIIRKPKNMEKHKLSLENDELVFELTFKYLIDDTTVESKVILSSLRTFWDVDKLPK